MKITKTERTGNKLKIFTNKKYHKITLDEKIQLSEKYGGEFYGADFDNKKTVIILLLNNL